MADIQNNKRAKTLLNDYRGLHPRTASIVNGAKYPGQLMWDIANNGKIILKANDGVYSEGSYQKKEVEVDFYNRNAIFQLLLDAANNPTFKKANYTIKNYGFVRGANGNQRSESPMKLAEITIIRSDEGVISLGFSKSDYKVLFSFDRPGYSELRELVNGEYVPANGKLSQVFVRGYVESMGALLNRIEYDNHVPPKPKDGGGNNSWGNKGGGNNNRKQDDDFDDDVNF